jgi:hypothetical protein
LDLPAKEPTDVAHRFNLDVFRIYMEMFNGTCRGNQGFQLGTLTTRPGIVLMIANKISIYSSV